VVLHTYIHTHTHTPLDQAALARARRAHGQHLDPVDLHSFRRAPAPALLRGSPGHSDEFVATVCVTVQ
jgi:hypothetical protein